MIPTITAQL